MVSIIGAGLPALAITIGARCSATSAASSIDRVFDLWTIRFGAKGAAPFVSPTIWPSYASNSSRVRQLAVGNEPMMPHRHAAMTSSGPDTKNIGAEINGSRRFFAISGGNRIRSITPHKRNERALN